MRLHTLATPAQFAARLAQCFGAHASFDDALGARLKRGLLALLAAGDKAECTSPLGLALLHQRVEGGLTPAMIDCVKDADAVERGSAVLLARAEACFDEAAADAGGASGLTSATRCATRCAGASTSTATGASPSTSTGSGCSGRSGARRTTSTASTTSSRPSCGAASCPGSWGGPKA